MPVTVFWEVALLLWFSTLPGMLVLSRVRLDLSLVERFALGTALGFGITPLCFMLLRTFDAWGYTSLVISIANVLTLSYLFLRGTWKERGMPQQIATSPSRRIIADPALEAPRNDSRLIGLLCGVSVALVLFYNFSGFHYTADGSLQMRGLFAIDVPFLIGIMPSFDLTGRLSDMHQNGLTYAYHDLTYILIATAKQVAGAEYFSLIAYSFPILGMSLASIALYVFVRSFFESARAFDIMIAALLLSSIWGDHILTGALSPSWLAGIVVLIAILIVLRKNIGPIRPMRPIGPISLLLALLLILLKTKLPIYLLIGGSIGLLGLTYLKSDRKTAAFLLIPAIASLPFVLLFSEANPYQPAGDFVIGAPLMGYANALASVLHVHPATVDPIIRHFDFELEDLLIPIYTTIHLLRMIALDARLLLFIAAIIFLRKHVGHEYRWLVTLGGFATLLGVLLPVLYSPAWYPLAISFYTPELAGFVGSIIAMLLIKMHWKQLSRVAVMITTLCIFYGALSNSRHIVAQLTAQEYTLSGAEVRSLEWIRHNTEADATIASTRYDLDLTDSTNDESFYLYGALSQRKTVSAGAKYGGLLAAVADYDSIKGLHPVEAATTALTQRRMDIFTMYRSLNERLIAEKMNAYGVDYVLVTLDPKLMRQDMPNAQNQFEPVYHSDELPVLRYKRGSIPPLPTR